MLMKKTRMRRAAVMGVLVVGVVLLVGMTCAVRGADEAPVALASGSYALKIHVVVGPNGEKEDHGEATLSAELTVKDETITLKVKPEDGEELVFSGSIEKGIIKFGATKEEQGKVITWKFEDKVKSDGEAGGAVTASRGEEKVSGKWTLKMNDAKEAK